jgi:YegS/Rv2252/BmrU family lipid kinase
MSALVVVNPRSGGGRTQREWPQIQAALEAVYPNMSVMATRKRGDATAIVRQALLEGCSEVVAVGGDGTINEAMNGFFTERGPISSDAVFGFITRGTGGDFRKTFGIAPGYEAAIARLKTAKVHAVDVGRISCVSRGGAPVVRYFINIASFGMSGMIVQSVNRARIAKLFGGRFAFAFHSLMGLLRYRDRAVRIRVDQSFDEITHISTTAVANGQYFGGGMKVAPHARPDDGQFDVIVMGGTPKSRAMADMKLLYTGEHLNTPGVREMRGNRVVAVPVAETGGHAVWIEADGESVGRLPATFEILPRALNLRC